VKPGVEVIQKVGMITMSAPSAINSRNASGKAKSQQINIPTRPTGVSIASWRSCPEEVKCGRSGCQIFFFRYEPRMLPSLEIKYAVL
jgi:hypothetical protein